MAIGSVYGGVSSGVTEGEDIDIALLGHYPYYKQEIINVVTDVNQVAYNQNINPNYYSANRHIYRINADGSITQTTASQFVALTTTPVDIGRNYLYSFYSTNNYIRGYGLDTGTLDAQSPTFTGVTNSSPIVYCNALDVVVVATNQHHIVVVSGDLSTVHLDVLGSGTGLAIQNVRYNIPTAEFYIIVGSSTGLYYYNYDATTWTLNSSSQFETSTNFSTFYPSYFLEDYTTFVTGYLTNIRLYDITNVTGTYEWTRSLGTGNVTEMIYHDEINNHIDNFYDTGTYTFFEKLNFSTGAVEVPNRLAYNVQDFNNYCSGQCDCTRNGWGGNMQTSNAQNMVSFFSRGIKIPE